MGIKGSKNMYREKYIDIVDADLLTQELGKSSSLSLLQKPSIMFLFCQN